MWVGGGYDRCIYFKAFVGGYKWRERLIYIQLMPSQRLSTSWDDVKHNSHTMSIISS
jgi:hypothetical protein